MASSWNYLPGKTRRQFLHLVGLGTIGAFIPKSLSGADHGDPVSISVQRMAQHGLAYLAHSQLDDGSWPENGQGAGVVGACVLAFLAHGHLPTRSDLGYDRTVSRACAWLVRQVRPIDGAIIGLGPCPMYQHGLATLALAEVYGSCRQLALRPTLAGCVNLIARCQNHRGGWRHEISTLDGDELPGSVGQLMALRSAFNAGIEVPIDIVKAGGAYVRRCQNRYANGGDGGFRYTIESIESSWARTGAGCCALQMAGTYDDDAIYEGLSCIDRYLQLDMQHSIELLWWHFGAYYVALAAWQSRRLPGGEQRWQRLFAGLCRTLLESQDPNGAWPGEYAPYETAASLLVLSFPNEYLPIHQS